MQYFLSFHYSNFNQSFYAFWITAAENSGFTIEKKKKIYVTHVTNIFLLRDYVRKLVMSIGNSIFHPTTNNGIKMSIMYKKYWIYEPSEARVISQIVDSELPFNSDTNKALVKTTFRCYHVLY